MKESRQIKNDNTRIILIGAMSALWCEIDSKGIQGEIETPPYLFHRRVDHSADGLLNAKTIDKKNAAGNKNVYTFTFKAEGAETCTAPAPQAVPQSIIDDSGSDLKVF